MWRHRAIQRNVTIEDVGNAGRFWARTSRPHQRRSLYVDGGYRTVGMSFPAMATALKQASDRTMD